MEKISFNWKEYSDNSCKGEDLWGHYKTHNGDLFIVADGASSHDGTKTGKDVVELIDRRLEQGAGSIRHRSDMRDLIHAINTESARKNEGAYAAIAGILHRRNFLYGFSAGDVSIIGKKINGKLIQVLPLDLSMQKEEAEKRAKDEIGKIINDVEITKYNYAKRVKQYMHHGLCNAVGFGEEFFLHDITFNARDGAVILIASDGVTDAYMQPQREAGKISRSDAPKLYDIFASKNAEQAAESLGELFWDTQVKEKKKIKPDDRTALFFYMDS